METTAFSPGVQAYMTRGAQMMEAAARQRAIMRGKKFDTIAVHGLPALLGRVDWASKYWMLTEFMQAQDLGWQDPWVKSLDLEYHNLNKSQGLYWGLEDTGDAFRRTSDSAVDQAKEKPPRGTRADGRGELVRTLTQSQTGYLIDWIGFRLNKEEPFLMLDPFVSYKKEIRNYLDNLDLQQPYDRDSFYR